MSGPAAFSGPAGLGFEEEVEMLDIGSKAPDFDLEDQEGKRHSLSALRGSWVVLYFYPKDDTPGCTTEACEFRDNKSVIEAAGAKVLGVSGDDRESHSKFANKHGLNFPILVDQDLQVIKAYGAYGEKQSFGKTRMGINRVTYLIDPRGNVAKVWPKVTPEGHASEVRQAIDELKVTA